MLTNAETPQGPPISSKECPQERRSSADSYSPSNRTKRRSVVASVDPDNGDLPINHKHATSNGKRQKYTKTLSETLSTSNGKAKIFPSLREQREQLPIARGRESLIRSIASNNVVIVLGETGSGKSTQLPQYLLEDGSYRGQIAVTQPRRVAATTLAIRVSAEQGQALGTLVGYSVRFDERVSPGTRIKYLTDGMLVREMMADPLLTRYDVVIVDEAHERTLRTDVVLAGLKRILPMRNGDSADRKGKSKANPLKVVVMSATLDAEKFSTVFREVAPVLYVKGRQHPVSIFHTSTSQNDYCRRRIHLDRPPGDVLIFLPDDIESLESSLRMYADQLPPDVPKVIINSLYASLSMRSKQSVPPTLRRFAQMHITKSSAMQRTGRAGREGHGYCFRLYTEEAFNSMATSAQPEIQRTNLTEALLMLKVIGQDLDRMPFMDRPDQESVGSALRTLWLLDAIDNSRCLTDFGRSLAMFPLEPQYATTLLTSVKHRCTSEVISLLSLLSSSAPLFPDIISQRDAASEARAKFRHPSGDHWTMLNAFRAYDEICVSEDKSGRKDWCKRNFVNQRALREASDIRTQLRGVCDRMNIDSNISCGNEEAPVLKSLLKGLLQQVAFLQPDGSYKQMMGPSIVKIHPSSFLIDKRSPAIIYDKLVCTTNIYARCVSAIYKSFIAEFPKLGGMRVP
ncbi:P-loop containing nucleoside triphosphate hydrolase protein [Lactarius deliciosus]|nr:P-loop containing nucleoside triphosphate hydrolase protein [Lactarius deliciosus]